MEIIHHINITIHVIAGTLALIAGIAAALFYKGSQKHIRFGKYFMWMIVLVILTGLIGVFVFKRNNFLLVITLLSGYNCFSGIRTIRLAGKKPRLIDYVIPIIVILSALYYLYFIITLGLYWPAVIIYSTIGALLLITIYDLSRAFLPVSLLKKAVTYEHTYKMISALAAISSAFSGTVLPQYKPYSQFLPSVIGITLIFTIFMRMTIKQHASKRTAILRQVD
ncbi:uncharacterized membrane protein HdeD (DUF308 family) [Pedobacter cryoconitis]|uniref:Uncharacterized membrane protein HdeD (DUF308 family) n=1 Tax=Pedobacter cryoconitis TaxID=188932 RepID=A0A7W8ZRC6_9SPHI|nr:hypothetical protein [Pedobacter cryoconitis]MBB5638772.1 uncharacterized membrane protein HdeD (DUF308 family) [Pedobacter cryoconitis]MBB6270218.1 uncharacterized membrane protein HdeD (DUF308 family) [Pedobacter cryoconitis]